MSLSLPAVLEKDGNQRTASTPAEYWDLVYRGFSASDADPDTVGLSPQQKAARTRAANKAKAESENSSDQVETAGTASDGEGDLTDANDDPLSS